MSNIQDKVVVITGASSGIGELSKTQIALGWMLQKSTAPIVGATKISHIEDAVSALPVTLTDDEVAYLEEPYVPHKIVGHV